MSQHTRPSWRVRRSWPEIFELMNVGLPNQIAGANRRPPWASATALGSRSSTWLAHVGSQAAVAQLHRYAALPSAMVFRSSAFPYDRTLVAGPVGWIVFHRFTFSYLRLAP